MSDDQALKVRVVHKAPNVWTFATDSDFTVIALYHAYVLLVEKTLMPPASLIISGLDGKKQADEVLGHVGLGSSIHVTMAPGLPEDGWILLNAKGAVWSNGV